jgi:hypothetical protein
MNENMNTINRTAEIILDARKEVNINIEETYVGM